MRVSIALVLYWENAAREILDRGEKRQLNLIKQSADSQKSTAQQSKLFICTPNIL